MSGAEVIVPLIAAGVGAATSIHSTQQQTEAAKKQRHMQQAALQKQESVQRKQQAIAIDEKQRLQIEQSDEIRRSRRRGRRSLLAGEETGVDLLGQRKGGL